eukprot:jgi/Chlat1/5183/Chrsp33S05160
MAPQAQMPLLRAVACACLLGLLWCRDAVAQTISHIYTSPDGSTGAYGSFAGGTYLYIQGTGFSSDAYYGGNDVYIGGVPCPIVCETIPLEDDTLRNMWLPVTVVVDKKRRATCPQGDTYCRYIYYYWDTPLLYEVSPGGGAPGDSAAFISRDGWDRTTTA